MIQSWFASEKHVLYVGWVIGKMLADGLDVEPVLDSQGNYSDWINLTVGDRKITLIVPEPEDDWEIA